MLPRGAAPRDLARGLNPVPPPLLCVGVKAGFEAATGGGALAVGALDPAEYFAPEASEIF